MKTRKKERKIPILALLGLLISAALMIGCPGYSTDNDDNPSPGTGQGHSISLEAVPINGKVRISPENASKDATVTIPLDPEAGFEPANLVAYRTGRYPIDDITPGAAAYTYTFTMPDSPVVVHVEFVTRVSAVKIASNKILASSSWAEIDALNELIKRTVNSNTASVRGRAEEEEPEKIIKDAIKKLAGEEAGNNTNEEDKTYSTPGIIRQKIQSEDMAKQEEGMTKIGGTLASFPQHLQARVNPTPGSVTNYMTQLTILYYVESKNNAGISVTPAKGWEIESRTIVDPKTNGTNGDPTDPYIFPYGINESSKIELVYTVGAGVSPYTAEVKHILWLVPVAQYEVEFVDVSGTVTIEDTGTSDVNTSVGVKKWKNTIADDSTKKICTGMVGTGEKDENGTAKSITTKISGDPSTLRITVTDEKGITVTTPASFKPISQVYKVKVTKAPTT